MMQAFLWSFFGFAAQNALKQGVGSGLALSSSEFLLASVPVFSLQRLDEQARADGMGRGVDAFGAL
jgi:hypothetical protein